MRRAAEPETPELGTRYRAASKARVGGVGSVIEAIDTLLDRHVAIKFLHDPGMSVESAIREARVMAGLRHRSICRVLEVVLDPPAGVRREAWRPFIVMEWVEGQRLSDAWQSMPFERRLLLFTQVVEAVASMHAVGLVHRDLKPSNILCDREGVPVLVDFGLSGRVGIGQRLGGTPGWSAPEQFAPDAEVGPAADVFALGVLFFNMLTGALPFDGMSTADVLRRAREGDAPLPESLRPGIAAPLQRIALAAIDPDPPDRYRDAAALLADLRRFRAGETVLAKPRRLYNRFGEEIERHLADTERWQKQGLAIESELRPIRDGLRMLQRPESPWILDSRRLSFSQVTMYLGGWLLVLAMTIGVWNTTEILRSQGARLDATLPAGLAALVTALGFGLLRLGEQRTALGFLFTSAVVVPLALWQFLRIEDLLGSDARIPLSFGGIGLSNAQQMLVAGSGLALSLLYRRLVPSTAFTLLAVIAGVWVWLALGCRLLDGAPGSRESAGELLRWITCAASALVAFGLLLDRRSSRPAADLLTITPPRDGSPALVVGLVLTLLCLAGLAWMVPEWIWFHPLDRASGGGITREPTDTQRAGGLLGAGMLLLTLSLGLGAPSATPLRDRCGRALRWFVPSFILIPIAWLEIEAASPGWGFWMALLAAAAVGFVASSALLQWRPFLLSGLLAFIDVFTRSFIRVDQLPGEASGRKLALTVGVAVLGVLVMLMASYPERTMRAVISLRRRISSLSIR